MKDMKVVELFAGVGGFRLGLEKANKDKYNTIWANQWEPGAKVQHAYNCYVQNWPNTKKSQCVNEDIATVLDKVPKHDLLVGGFPCQDYSVARTKAKGIEGKKGVLWWNIDNIIGNEKIAPKYVLLENVDRLLKSPTAMRGRDFAIILKCFADKGYNVDWMMINAAEYGMQQKRRRVFIFAHKDKKDKINLDKYDENTLIKNHFFCDNEKYGFKVKDLSVKSLDLNEYEDIVDVSNNFSKGKFLNFGKMRQGKVLMSDYKADYNGPMKTLQDIRDKSTEENKKKFHYLTAEDIVKASATKDSKRIERTATTGFKYNYSEGKMDFPDKWTSTARTMLTSEGTLNRSTHYVAEDDGKIRILTPEECEKINGFPAGWTDGCGMQSRNRYFCMGNALVVDLIERFGLLLDEYDK